MRSKVKKGYYLLLSGVLAGIVNGLLGAGGGIIVVYALGIVLGDELCDVRDVFSNALCVMLPISAVSCVGYALMGELSTDGIGVFIIPAIIGGAAGGLLYLLVPNEGIFTYSPATGAWSELHPFGEREITLLCTGRDECLFVDGDGAVYSTKEGVARPFEVCTTPFVPELSAPFRLVRLRLTMTAAPAASLEILCRNSRGEEVSVATLTGDGRTRRESVRIPIGADTATTLCLRGQGEITVTAMETVVAVTATDGA